MSKTVYLRVRITPNLAQAVDRLADNIQLNRSELVRRVLESEVTKYDCWLSGDQQRGARGRSKPPGGVQAADDG